jgi:hypothetical protein
MRYGTFINNTKKASRQTHTQETTTQINEEKQNRKNTNGNVQSVTQKKAKKKKQRNRLIQAYEIKVSHTPKDGHVGRNM